MEFIYWLPNDSSQKQDYKTESNSVIIIGANGSGKSKLGAWIEQQNFEQVHRIGAQRNLNFNENIQLKNYAEAENIVFYGSIPSAGYAQKMLRWNYGQSYTTTLMDDFENVLAALIAKKNNTNDKFTAQYKTTTTDARHKLQEPITVIDKLQEIWNTVFPQRKLRIDDSKFYAVLEKEGGEEVYSATQMSDGERSVLYLAAQVLCVLDGKTLIMDEPEIHLHRSIMSRLWLTLESHRPDCLFIYITHDTQFAAMHSHADKIWIKEFDGSNWKLEKINNDELPEELLLDILGSRKNVLFVEGEKNSYDTQLYTALYPDYHVIACGSCSQVIMRTKAFKNNPALHHCSVFGIIDRDFRCEYEIAKYAEDNIFAVNVAEVENLFLAEELIRILAERFSCDPDETFDEIKKYIINDRFEKQLTKQICQSVIAEVKYTLASAEISAKSNAEAKASLDTLFQSIDYEKIKTKQEEKFNAVLINVDYATVIKVFNEKNVVKSIGCFFEMNNSAFCPKVIKLLHGDLREKIIAAPQKYLPPEISR